MTVAVLPEVGSRWRHRKNKRFVIVKDIVAGGSRDEDLQVTIGYAYVRTPGGGPGFKRGVSPRQDASWLHWHEFFVEVPR